MFSCVSYLLPPHYDHTPHEIRLFEEKRVQLSSRRLHTSDCYESMVDEFRDELEDFQDMNSTMSRSTWREYNSIRRQLNTAREGHGKALEVEAMAGRNVEEQEAVHKTKQEESKKAQAEERRKKREEAQTKKDARSKRKLRNTGPHDPALKISSIEYAQEDDHKTGAATTKPLQGYTMTLRSAKKARVE